MFFVTVLALIGLAILVAGTVAAVWLIRERIEASPVEVLDVDPHRDALSAVERMQAEMFSAAQGIRRAQRDESG